MSEAATTPQPEGLNALLDRVIQLLIIRSEGVDTSSAKKEMDQRIYDTIVLITKLYNASPEQFENKFKDICLLLYQSGSADNSFIRELVTHISQEPYGTEAVQLLNMVIENYTTTLEEAQSSNKDTFSSLPDEVASIFLSGMDNEGRIPYRHFLQAFTLEGELAIVYVQASTTKENGSNPTQCRVLFNQEGSMVVYVIPMSDYPWENFSIDDGDDAIRNYTYGLNSVAQVSEGAEISQQYAIKCAMVAISMYRIGISEQGKSIVEQHLRSGALNTNAIVTISNVVSILQQQNLQDVAELVRKALQMIFEYTGLGEAYFNCA